MVEIELLKQQLELIELEKAKLEQLLIIEKKINQNLKEQNEQLKTEILEKLTQ